MGIKLDFSSLKPATLNISTLNDWHKYEFWCPELAERRAISMMNNIYLTQAQMYQALLDSHIPNPEAVCELRWLTAPVFKDQPALDEKIYFTQFRGEMTEKGIEYYNIRKNAEAAKKEEK